MTTHVRWIRTLMLAVLLAPAGLHSQEPAIITGQVTSPSGDPETGVSVRIPTLNVGATTAADGRYRLVVPGSRIRAGQAVTVTAARVGLTSQSRTLVLAPGATLTQNFQLSRNVVQLEGIVVTGQPSTLERVRVRSSVAMVASVPSTVSHPHPGWNTESYSRIDENSFRAVSDHPLSTFSADVDRASYTNVRRFLTEGRRPPKDAVRIEEMINYFPYEYPRPRGTDPIGIRAEVADAPWRAGHRLVRIALGTAPVDMRSAPPSNLVFLVDVSGSMSSEDRLPLVQRSLRLLVNELRERDRVAIVVYAGAAGLVLPSTSGSDRGAIMDAIERLEAGGSTAGGAGLRLAYDVARRHHIRGGNNRVILATDGDFNVGVSSDAEMTRLVEEKRAQGTFLTVLGFGRGNLKDSKMEALADHGNGNYAYIDNLLEARKVLVREIGGTLLTVAKDVKLQVEFNPQRVRAYRLIGYENRLLANEDFSDDSKDAGEMGAGHTVTALYEIIPVGVRSDVAVRRADSLRYRRSDLPPRGRPTGEIAFVKVRYKLPDGDRSRLMEAPIHESDHSASDDLRFAAAVAGFGMLLRESEHRGSLTLGQVVRLAERSRGADSDGYRAEFVRLVRRFGELRTVEGSEEEAEGGR